MALKMFGILGGAGAVAFCIAVRSATCSLLTLFTPQAELQPASVGPASGFKSDLLCTISLKLS